MPRKKTYRTYTVHAFGENHCVYTLKIEAHRKVLGQSWVSFFGDGEEYYFPTDSICMIETKDESIKIPKNENKTKLEVLHNVKK